METPTKDQDLKSHHISGLSEELTPASSSTVPATSAADQPQQEASGGVTGYLKSWIQGSGANADSAPHPDQQTTHVQDLKDGSTAAVHTAPESSAVPTSLQESPHTVGSARTEFKQPVSEYASALEGIAGEPVAHDPSAKYAPALGALTGDAPATGQGTGVVGAVAAAAGSVYHGVAQAVGYEDTPGAGTTASTTPATGTTEPQSIGSEKPALEYETAAPESAALGATGTEGAAAGGSAITPADLPKSGVVDTSSGTADITAKEQPGYLASAAGTVSNAAAGLKDRVAGIYGGTGETGNTATAGEGLSKGTTGVLYEDEAPAAGTGAAAGVGSATAADVAPSSTTATKGASATSAEPISATDGASSTTAAGPAVTTSDAPSTSTKEAAFTTAGAPSSTATPSAATEAIKAAPVEAQNATTGGTAVPTTKSEAAQETPAAPKPTVSAFAADSKNPAKEAKAGEITEEAGLKKPAASKEATATGAVTGAEDKLGTTGAAGAAEKKAETGTTGAVEKKAGTEAAKKEEKKAQSKCCGCTIQ